MGKGKNKKLNFIIPLVVYPFDIMVSIGETNEEIASVLIGIGIPEDDIELSQFENDTVKGRAIRFSTNQSLIRLREYPKTNIDFGVLAHEVFHCVSFIMDKIGMPLRIGVSDEAYAYLIEYITEEIYNHL